MVEMPIITGEDNDLLVMLEVLKADRSVLVISIKNGVVPLSDQSLKKSPFSTSVLCLFPHFINVRDEEARDQDHCYDKKYAYFV